MNSIRTLIAAFVLLTCGCSDPGEFNGRSQRVDSATSIDEEFLVLDVDYSTRPSPDDEANVIFMFLITITNVGDEEVTVPTRSFNGTPCCWTEGMDQWGVSYVVGEHRIANKRITPSPLRFDPMVLRPGETTEFARYTVTIQPDETIRWFSAGLKVEEDYGKVNGWWTGSLHVRIDLDEKEPDSGMFF